MHPNRRHLNHASGYLTLGMLDDAATELAAVRGPEREQPEFLALLSSLHMETKAWEPLLTVSRELAQRAPKTEQGWISWAFALRELNRVEEARAVLLEAEPLHGKKSALIHYNLACYYCLLGDFPEARLRLKRACKMDAAWKDAALGDIDLKAMWAEIAAMK